MTYIDSLRAGDSPSIDAFGRWRTSEPETLFDGKQIHDNLPLLWDEQEVSGSGTAGVHSAFKASTIMTVSATTAGRRVRQTFMRFNYQPGKSQLIFMTGTLSSTGGGTGIVRCMGIYDDDNGMFAKDNQGTLEFVCRGSMTGSAVDATVAQSAWNLDKLDGTGPSGITLDPTKSQILVLDYEWLGVGRARIGFVFDGLIVYGHEFLNSNNLSGVYMSTPNLPLRYEIENTGAGAASGLECICATVISEGGVHKGGVLRYASTNGTHVDANVANTVYALVGIRLKTGYSGADVELEAATVLAETNDDFEWIIMFNPTIAGTFTYSDEANSAVQAARGATANTVTGGYAMDGGFSTHVSSISTGLENAIHMGKNIAGTRDAVVLCARPLGTNADIQGSLAWREVM